MSSPHIFDQEVVARPCRSGCEAHAHTAHLPTYAENRYGEPGDNVPTGWTAQHAPWGRPPDEVWFVCNSCSSIVAESAIPDHVCDDPDA